MISAYYYVGGLTGASLVMSAAAQFSNSNARESLIRRCRWIAFVGSGISSALLVADLGRPERFLNMLRVFRPTSPMNIGAWILSGVGATGTAALMLGRRAGLLGSLGNVTGVLAGIFGAGLATYTGVLVSNSAVPIWQQSRRYMPILFGASAMASVGSAFNAMVGSHAERRFTAPFGLIGQAVELGAGAIMQRQASRVERVGRPFNHGAGGAMWRTAAALTAASLLLGLLPGKSKTQRVISGVLGTLGGALMRFSIEQMGKASARDARASFHQQRAGAGAQEVTGRTSRVSASWPPPPPPVPHR
jgi:formate-dependent nitrite reductase membrane component NrfD